MFSPDLLSVPVPVVFSLCIKERAHTEEAVHVLTGVVLYICGVVAVVSGAVSLSRFDLFVLVEGWTGEDEWPYLNELENGFRSIRNLFRQTSVFKNFENDATRSLVISLRVCFVSESQQLPHETLAHLL